MIKQVIVIRRDLKMRRGKEIAQGSHASMAFLASRARMGVGPDGIIDVYKKELEWLQRSQTKITLKVNSEEELLALHAEACAAGLQSHIITDSGKTEFNGVPTMTCLAIGPDEADDIDKITGKLELY